MAPKFRAIIDYEEPYVQPLILAALKTCLPDTSYTLLNPSESLDNTGAGVQETPLLQFRSYESLDFALAINSPTDQINAYIIRKGLIRKHYLSHTIHSWVTKHPSSPLTQHFKPAEELELDYAEFLDDALVEAFELRASFERNESLQPGEREWWILKPSMSDRGQGIRLFSCEEELRAVFEAWEVDEDEDEEDEMSDLADDGVVTSHLRHFIVQPYIHPPLLVSEAPFCNRKFHIRTYVVAAGALRVYVYEHMLALFASEPYTPPWVTSSNDHENILDRLRNVHLTNTCVQTSRREEIEGTIPESVHLLSKLPLSSTIQAQIQDQIFSATGELFRATLAQPTNFQPLPQAFEIFGVDFLVEGEVEDGINVQLLEVNAFPDFRQTGDELKDVVIKGLFEAVFNVVIGPHFGVERKEGGTKTSLLKQVFEIEMGRK